MLKKHGLGITPYIENISSRDQSLVRMGTSRVTLPVGAKKCCQNRNYIYDYDKYIYFTNNLMVILIIKYKRITHDDINKEQVNIHI